MTKITRKLKKIFLALQSPILRRGLRFGVGPAYEHGGILAPLQLATIVDIGANKGQFSLLARQLHPMAQIFAFEPLGKPAKKYCQIFARDSKTAFYQIAIGPTSITADMHVSGRDDSSSLLSITEDQVAFAPGTQEVGRERVRVAPLSETLLQQEITEPALLKIDVQGFELSALEGCESLLRRFSHIYVELSFVPFYENQALAYEVINWLAARQFYLTAIHNPVRAKSSIIVQADFLFYRPS